MRIYIAIVRERGTDNEAVAFPSHTEDGAIRAAYDGFCDGYGIEDTYATPEAFWASDEFETSVDYHIL